MNKIASQIYRTRYGKFIEICSVAVKRSEAGAITGVCSEKLSFHRKIGVN